MYLELTLRAKRRKLNTPAQGKSIAVEFRMSRIFSSKTWHVLALAIAIHALGCEPRHDADVNDANRTANNVIGSGIPTALNDIHGVEQSPFNDRDAVATVLVFTMQDCPIANSYVPTLSTLASEYHPRGIRFLMVHVDPQLSNESARKHAEEFQIEVPVVIDRQHAWVDWAGATKSPEVAVFSSDGQILYSGRIDDRYVGFGKRRTHVSSNDLREAMDAILAGRPVARSKTEAIGCFIPPLGG
jgi:Redoxin